MARPRWCVYVLRCGDGSLYTGATNDLERRLLRHAAGTGARYTRSRLPVALVHSERMPDRSAALRREAAVKKLTRAEKLALVERAVAGAAGRARLSAPRAGRAAPQSQIRYSMRSRPMRSASPAMGSLCPRTRSGANSATRRATALGSFGAVTKRPAT